MRHERRETSRIMSVKWAAKLQQKKHRETEKLFLAEGGFLVNESPEPPCRIFESSDHVRRLSTLTTPSGPVGVFPFLDVSGEELLASCERIVLLHGVQDPGNVGTIIRAAHAFGAGVALSRRCADLYNPKTVRSTMGSIFHAPVAREVESPEFLGLANSTDFMTTAAILGDKSSPRDMPSDKLVVVVGSEGAGLPEDLVAVCERRVEIPSRASSLNAAMAASILLYEAYMRVLP